MYWGFHVQLGDLLPISGQSNTVTFAEPYIEDSHLKPNNMLLNPLTQILTSYNLFEEVICNLQKYCSSYKYERRNFCLDVTP